MKAAEVTKGQFMSFWFELYIVLVTLLFANLLIGVIIDGFTAVSEMTTKKGTSARAGVHCYYMREEGGACCCIVGDVFPWDEDTGCFSAFLQTKSVLTHISTNPSIFDFHTSSPPTSSPSPFPLCTHAPTSLSPSLPLSLSLSPLFTGTDFDQAMRSMGTNDPNEREFVQVTLPVDHFPYVTVRRKYVDEGGRGGGEDGREQERERERERGERERGVNEGFCTQMRDHVTPVCPDCTVLTHTHPPPPPRLPPPPLPPLPLLSQVRRRPVPCA